MFSLYIYDFIFYLSLDSYRYVFIGRITKTEHAQ